MPKEVRKRGRRAEKARKEEKLQEEEELKKQEEQYNQNERYDDHNDNDDSYGYHEDGEDGEDGDNQMSFFGLLDDQELEYFKQAESTLGVDAFGSPEERRGFVFSVFEETRGKELKLVTNHICSRLVERLILLANDKQILDLLKAFNGHFPELSKHKFASHVVETLLARAVPLVEREMLDPEFLANLSNNSSEDEKNNDITTVESLFLYMVNEIKPTVKSMPQHPYASHFLRLLLLILAGKPIPSATEGKSALRSRRSKAARKKIILGGNSRSNVGNLDDESSSTTTTTSSRHDDETEERAYQVPSSFGEALNEIINELVKDLDTTTAREMSIHPISSPVVQLILGIESDKIADINKHKIKIPKDSLIATLLPYSSDRYKKKDVIDIEDEAEKEAKTKEIKESEEAYMEYLLSDAVGSHLLEVTIDKLPAKLTGRLADRYMVGRIGKLVRRQESGNYVVQALLRRLSGRKDVATKILDELIEEIQQKLFPSDEAANDNDSKTPSDPTEINYGLVRTTLQVSTQTLGGYKCSEIIDILLKKYDPKKEGKILSTLLAISTSNKGSNNDSNTTEDQGPVISTAVLGGNYDNNTNAVKMQKALLLQTMMDVSTTVIELVLEELIKIGDEGEPGIALLLRLGRDSILSHVFEKALVVNTASNNLVQRRRLLNHLSNSKICCDFAANVYGSHIVDKMWEFCFRLKFFRERVAQELAQQESEIKMTPYGRSVWKNWKMDDYIRRRRDWWNKIKAQEDEINERLGMERKTLGPTDPKEKKQNNKDDKKSGKTRHVPFNSKNRTKIY